MSEESNAGNEMKGRCWVIDPIDEIVCFSPDLFSWCIQMAFVVDEVVKLSAIYCPNEKALYSADENGMRRNGKSVKINRNNEVLKSIINLGNFVKNIKVLTC